MYGISVLFNLGILVRATSYVNVVPMKSRGYNFCRRIHFGSRNQYHKSQGLKRKTISASVDLKVMLRPKTSVSLAFPIPSFLFMDVHKI